MRPTENTHGQQSTVPRSAENKNISVLYTNARSLLSKRDEALAYIDVENPDVDAITEFWPTSDHLMTEFSITGYESIYKNILHRCYMLRQEQIPDIENTQRGLCEI